jgi:hypothetical protein
MFVTSVCADVDAFVTQLFSHVVSPLAHALRHVMIPMHAESFAQVCVSEQHIDEMQEAQDADVITNPQADVPPPPPASALGPPELPPPPPELPPPPPLDPPVTFEHWLEQFCEAHVAMFCSAEVQDEVDDVHDAEELYMPLGHWQLMTELQELS